MNLISKKCMCHEKQFLKGQKSCSKWKETKEVWQGDAMYDLWLDVESPPPKAIKNILGANLEIWILIIYETLLYQY